MSPSILVLVHDVILATAEDNTATFAARRASIFALDALEGDAEFLSRTCDCRTSATTKKAHKKALEQILQGFGDEEAEGDPKAEAESKAAQDPKADHLYEEGTSQVLEDIANASEARSMSISPEPQEDAIVVD